MEITKSNKDKYREALDNGWWAYNNMNIYTLKHPDGNTVLNIWRTKKSLKILSLDITGLFWELSNLSA